jgi:hypothetical protein
MSKVFEYYSSRKRIPISHKLGLQYEPTKLDYLDVSTDGGNGVSNSMYFTFDGELTEGEAMNLQEEYGYHPAGYGFYNFIVTQISTLEGDVVTTWECQRSCD